MMKKRVTLTKAKRRFKLALFVAAFCIFNFSFCILTAHGQAVVDKMVATVNGGGARPSLITYSDLLWQLALEPDASLDNPSSELLNRALNLIISQRLILQEAEKLPAIEPTSKDIDDRRNELVKRFPSLEGFQQRMAQVGLSGDQLREIVRQQLTIEKYVDFRFRSFTVITQKEVEDYYKDVWSQRFRRQHPGQLLPELKDVYKDVESELTESKIESDIDEFIDTAREHAEITTLNPV